MTSTSAPAPAKWAEFWNAQTTALNSDLATDQTDRYGAELRLLFPTTEPKRVLELGCGDGALFEALGFDRADRYLGVDFSASMLDEMRTRHPGVELVESSGHCFERDETFDLIFSAATVQYFDRAMLREHVERAARMLAPGGRLVCASTPWRRMRWAYACGDVARRSRRRFPVALLAHLKRLIGHDNMGYWHDLPEVRAMAADVGLSVEAYGSIHYPYRVHFVFERR
ncbi:MAG: class I SAM-dependent methyltransferase [Actinomycetota bacterium]